MANKLGFVIDVKALQHISPT
jgi:hypothetical protein